MGEIIRNRTIRPLSRLKTSKSYKINTENVSSGDNLVVNIDHETKPFKKSYRFKGSDVANKDSIHFKVNDYGTHIDISWSGVQPSGTAVTTTTPKQVVKRATPTRVKTATTLHTKKSFAALVSDDTEILILGTMPGDRSLQVGEYYAHPRNRFWKIIATITDNEVPTFYRDKKNLVSKNKIGLWDVAKAAYRKGSLDTNIVDSIPNDLDEFLKTYEKIRVIGFNGSKSADLFDKFFTRQPNIVYHNLASTSPANTGINFEQICNEWKRILK